MNRKKKGEIVSLDLIIFFLKSQRIMSFFRALITTINNNKRNRRKRKTNEKLTKMRQDNRTAHERNKEHKRLCVYMCPYIGFL